MNYLVILAALVSLISLVNGQLTCNQCQNLLSANDATCGTQYTTQSCNAGQVCSQVTATVSGTSITLYGCANDCTPTNNLFTQYDANFVNVTTNIQINTCCSTGNNCNGIQTPTSVQSTIMCYTCSNLNNPTQASCGTITNTTCALGQKCSMARSTIAGTVYQLYGCTDDCSLFSENDANFAYGTVKESCCSTHLCNQPPLNTLASSTSALTCYSCSNLANASDPTCGTISPTMCLPGQFCATSTSTVQEYGQITLYGCTMDWNLFGVNDGNFQYGPVTQSECNTNLCNTVSSSASVKQMSMFSSVLLLAVSFFYTKL